MNTTRWAKSEVDRLRETVMDLRKLRPTRALLVEDDLADCELFLESFRRVCADCICDVVHSSREAVEMLNTNDYALVFLDVDLRGGSGLDVLRQLRDTPLARRTIVVTGSLPAADMQKVLDLGVVSILGKPLKEEHLREVLT